MASSKVTFTPLTCTNDDQEADRFHLVDSDDEGFATYAKRPHRQRIRDGVPVRIPAPTVTDLYPVGTEIRSPLLNSGKPLIVRKHENLGGFDTVIASSEEYPTAYYAIDDTNVDELRVEVVS